MASKTKDFFENGNSAQFEWVLGLYDQCLRLRANSKSSKPENIIKLDKWYQNELPKKIKSRGKDMHLTHEEMVQTIKWKLARGKFRPNLVNLVQMNTPRVIIQDTKKAFRKLSKTDDVQAASGILCNLKGVGPAMASAVLAAGAPHMAPFMADECLLAMPDVDSLDYTMKEYMKYVEHIKGCVSRLNEQGGTWTPHSVELAIWSHYIANDLKPELLLDLPSATPAAVVAAVVAPPQPSSDVQPSDEKPLDVHPSDEKPSDVQPSDEKPLDVQPSDEKPAAPTNGPSDDSSNQVSDAKAETPTPETTPEPSEDVNGQAKNGHNEDSTSSSQASSTSEEPAAAPEKPVNGSTNGNGHSHVVDGTPAAAVDVSTNGNSENQENGTAKLSDDASEKATTGNGNATDAPEESSVVTKRAADDSGSSETSVPAPKKIRTEEPPSEESTTPVS